MSRVYDALRKLEEQGRESAENSSRTAVTPSKSFDQLLAASGLQAHIGPGNRLVAFSDRRSPGAERFRLLRMGLHNLNLGKALKVLLITSPLPEDGKSTMALNLATSLAEDGRVKVLLLEADLHRPSLVEHLGLDPFCGLTEVLEGSADLSAAVKRIEPLGFYLLPAGRHNDNPTELFQSDQFNALLRECRACFDCVLIDCPPAFPLADVTALKAHADGVLLVARADRTPREAVQETIQVFKPGSVVGLILNAADEVDRLYAHYYYRYGSSSPSDRLRQGRDGEPSSAKGSPFARNP